MVDRPKWTVIREKLNKRIGNLGIVCGALWEISATGLEPLRVWRLESRATGTTRRFCTFDTTGHFLALLG